MSNDATGIESSADTAITPSEAASVCASIMDTAIRIKLIRDAFGFSQRELAKRAGVTNSSISMIEQGQVSPSIQSLSRILAAFPISLADFFSFSLPPQTGTYPACELNGQSLISPPHQQLDARIEYLLAGQSTVFSAPKIDSCGVVLSGEVRLTLLAGNQLLSQGESFYIPACQPFRLINISVHDASLFRCSLFVHKG